MGSQLRNSHSIGMPSLMSLRNSARVSGVSLCPWTLAACWAAISSSSFSLSAEMATVHLLSLGNSRQSMYLPDPGRRSNPTVS